MDYIKLTERLIKALVVDEDAVSVKEFPSDETEELTFKPDWSTILSGWVSIACAILE